MLCPWKAKETHNTACLGQKAAAASGFEILSGQWWKQCISAQPATNSSHFQEPGKKRKKLCQCEKVTWIIMAEFGTHAFADSENSERRDEWCWVTALLRVQLQTLESPSSLRTVHLETGSWWRPGLVFQVAEKGRKGADLCDWLFNSLLFFQNRGHGLQILAPILGQIRKEILVKYFNVWWQKHE